MSHPNPLKLTVALSLATLLSYGAWRVWLATTEEAPAARPPVVLADQLPDFSLANLDGEPVSIRNWPDRPMVINFWATWCGPCLREIPLLKALQSAHPEIQVVGIAVDQPDAVAAFADDIDFNYPILVGIGDAMEAASILGIEVFVLPSTVFTTATGATLGIRVGEIHDEHLNELTATLAELEAGTVDLAGARQRLAGER